MTTSFYTIDASLGDGVEVETEIKRSRFLARLRRVESEEQARTVIAECRREYFDARHHCGAFVLGPDARTCRSFDDGEPAGTAGVPMLTVLQRSELTDVVAVVTRYFGGVKLGAGGLVRAYSDAVAAAVASIGRREVILSQLLSVEADLAEAGQLEEQLRGLTLPGGEPVVVQGTDWGQQAHIKVAIRSGHEADFQIALAALSAGRLSAQSIGQEWVDLPA